MRAAYYEANGAAHEVLRVGDIEAPSPGPAKSGSGLRLPGSTLPM